MYALCIRGILPIITGASSEKENWGVSLPRLPTLISANQIAEWPPETCIPRSIDLEVARGTKPLAPRLVPCQFTPPRPRESITHKTTLPASRPGVSPRELFIVIYPGLRISIRARKRTRIEPGGNGPKEKCYDASLDLLTATRVDISRFTARARARACCKHRDDPSPLVAEACRTKRNGLL